MISLNTLQQISDIMTVLNNTKKAIAKPSQSKQSFASIIAQQSANDPVKQSAIVQTTVKPDLRPRAFNDLCCMCDKPAVTWINGKPYCKEHKDVCH